MTTKLPERIWDETEFFCEMLDRLCADPRRDAEVAAEAGVSPSTVWYYRNGYRSNPQLRTLIKLGNVVGLELRWVRTGRKLRRVA